MCSVHRVAYSSLFPALVTDPTDWYFLCVIDEYKAMGTLPCANQTIMFSINENWLDNAFKKMISFCNVSDLLAFANRDWY